MQPRIEYRKIDPTVIQAMMNLGGESGLEQSLLDLVKVRASQINRCAYCLDMHTKDARASGETEQRLYGLSAWQEMPFYTDRERACLLWTEALTRISEASVSDAVYEQVRQQFSEAEMVTLTMTVIAINSWNRLNVGLRTAVAGGYKSRRNAQPA